MVAQSADQWRSRFDDISRVVPWIETAADLGLISTGHNAASRSLQSHLSYEQRSSSARYVVPSATPGRARLGISLFEGWFFETGSIDMETLGRVRFVKAGRTTRTSLRGGRIVTTRTCCCSRTANKNDHEVVVRRVPSSSVSETTRNGSAIACRIVARIMKAHHDSTTTS